MITVARSSDAKNTVQQAQVEQEQHIFNALSNCPCDAHRRLPIEL